MSEDVSPHGFQSLGLDDTLLGAINKAGYQTPTPIQQQAIPAVLAGDDVLGLAQTGTGKTAAFALPLLQLYAMQKARGARVLVIAPTRELVNQIDAEFRQFGKPLGLKTVSIYGGVSANPQVNALRGRPHVIVACPGRLLDLMSQKLVDLRQVDALVLDEADQMFDMGFLPDIRRIIKALPRERQNLLFSATMPKDIRRLANEILDQPTVIEIDFKGPAKTIEHACYRVANNQKLQLLQHLLDQPDVHRSIVFTRTKFRAKRIAQQLAKKGHVSTALQGNMSQSQRDRAMAGFRDGQFDVLVATDIAARGIDVSKVSHVVNYDVPSTAEAYTHRIGRTGRAERDGTALTFVAEDDLKQMRDIERRIGQEVAVLDLPALGDSGQSQGDPVARGNTRNDGDRHHPGRKGKPRREKAQGGAKQKSGESGDGNKRGKNADGGARNANGNKPGAAGGDAADARKRRRRRRRSRARNRAGRDG